MITSGSMLDVILYKSVVLFLRLWKLRTRQFGLFAALYCDVLLFDGDSIASYTSEDSGSEITLMTICF